MLQIDVLSAHRNFNTEQLVHTEAFTQKSLYTEKFLHTEAFTHRSVLHRESSYAEELLRTDALYTEKPLHRGAFAHRILYTQTLFTHTQKVLQTDNFTGHRTFYIEQLLRSEACTHRGLFYTEAFT